MYESIEAFDFPTYMDGTSEGYASMVFNSEMASKLWSEFCGPVDSAYTFNKARECISSSDNNSHPLQVFEKDGPLLAKEHIKHFPQP